MYTERYRKSKMEIPNHIQNSRIGGSIRSRRKPLLEVPGTWGEMLGACRTSMKPRINLLLILALTLTLLGVTLTMGEQTGPGRNVPPPRPRGPCDIYAGASDPCVAAHSTT